LILQPGHFSSGEKPKVPLSKTPGVPRGRSSHSGECDEKFFYD
jgi:hypothetical protein